MMTEGKAEQKKNGGDLGQNTVVDLPFEDIVWIIRRLEDVENDSDEESGLSSEVWTVVDTKQVFIGSAIRRDNQPPESFVLNLLMECIRLPFSWKPRRPKFVTFRGFGESGDGLNESVELDELGIIIVEDVHTKPWYSSSSLSCSIDHHALMQSCSKCQRRGSVALFTTCQHCDGVYYCSTECETRDLSDDQASHTEWCDRMANYVKETSVLADLPFTYTNAPGFDEKAYCDFQKSVGVFGQGLWRREAPQQLQTEYREYGDILHREHITNTLVTNTFAIDSLESRLQETTQEQQDSLKCRHLNTWQDYYTWRQLGLESPCAVLMHWTLTVYHILVNLMDELYPIQAMLILAKDTIRIHLIGVQKEVDILTIFYELEHLFPGKSFEITMVGNDISKKVNNKHVNHGSVLQFVFRRGLYHTLKHTHPPDVVIGFNAGVGAYSSWLPTLQYLSKNKLPAFFTDYCRYSCDCSRPAVQSIGRVDMSDVYVNPFRCPVRKYSEGTAFPWYSNGFVYCLKYTEPG